MIAKTALITGAAQRLGASICRQLHADGFNVIIHYHQHTSEAQQLTDELNQLRADSAVCLAADLLELEAIYQLAEQACGYWGRIDLLINNASSFYPTPVAEASDSDWQQLMGSNVKGAFFLCQALLPSLKQHRGNIINIIDIHAERPLQGYSLYCMAKAALAMMTKSLAKELAPEVRVNGISPGAILWPEREVSDQAKQQILDKIPLQKTGSKDDIVRSVSFLIESDYITGQIMAVDGGRSLQM